MVFAMFAVANKTVWELGPEWCARYMLVKYMLHMEDGSCSSAANRAADNSRPTQLSGGQIAVGDVKYSPF
jgi:hypothetical protein